MTTRIARFIMLLGGLFLLSACVSYQDIEVKDFSIDNFSMQGTKILVDISAVVFNPNRAFVIQEAGGELNRGQQPFATAQLLEAITIGAKSEQRYSGQLQLTVKDMMALFQMGTNAQSWDNSLLFTGDMRIKSGMVKKKFSYKEMPLNQLLNSL